MIAVHLQVIFLDVEGLVRADSFYFVTGEVL